MRVRNQKEKKWETDRNTDRQGKTKEGLQTWGGSTSPTARGRPRDRQNDKETERQDEKLTVLINIFKEGKSKRGNGKVKVFLLDGETDSDRETENQKDTD